MQFTFTNSFGSGKTIAIMQPTYLSWLGYFDLIACSDVFVIYDSVQFEKRSWQQRNRIRSKEGEIMLTVPVNYGEGQKRLIKDVEIDQTANIFKKHLNSIQRAYAKSSGFLPLYKDLELIYQAAPSRLVDLNVALIKLGMKHLNLENKIVFSSDLDVQGNKVEALIDICKKLDATRYYSPLGSKAYIDENNIFDSNGIELVYQDFKHPTYQQLNYSDFISHLAFIDYLFNSK